MIFKMIKDDKGILVTKFLFLWGDPLPQELCNWIMYEVKHRSQFEYDMQKEVMCVFAVYQ
jgi:hypothetical protein